MATNQASRWEMPHDRPQLFPKQPKRMKQPPKDFLREQLAAAADEIIRLRAQELANEDRIKSVRAALEGEAP